jgi:hypothetical protein
MSTPQEIELQKQHKSSSDKFIYFLFAAAGSAIGFAMTQTKTEPLTLLHIPLGIAVLCWIISFYAGIKCIEYTNGVTSLNFIYLQSTRQLSQHTPSKQGLEFASEMKSDFEKIAGTKGKEICLYSSLQKNCLLTGAIFYIISHITNMYRIGLS